MKNLETTRPTSVTAISWAFIGVGMVNLLQVLFSFLIKNFSKYKSPDVSLQAVFLKAHAFEVTLVQISLCALMVVCGIYFLKAKTWARISIEALAYAWLIILSGSFWFISQEISSLITTGQRGMFLYSHIIGIFRSSLFTALFMLALIFVIKLLHAEPVKTYLTPASPKA